MRILVTGGAGFIGSHLCRALLAEGHTVYCVDSFFSGKKENIADLLVHEQFSLLVHDIRTPLTFRHPLDRIYNLACPASPMQYQFDPVLTLETNVLGIQHMLALARKTGARLLQTSTSEVYGDPLEHPQQETYWGNVDPLGARSCYDEGKRAAETLCKDYHEQYGVETRIVRIFNTYGPGMMFNDGRVLSNFILQALGGESLTLHGDGSQTRSFCYVDDLVRGLMLAMERAQGDWFPINLGNPDERTIRDVAERVLSYTESNSTIETIPLEQVPGRVGDPKQRCPDISRATELLGWAPTVSFENGLKQTIADFRARQDQRTHVLVFVDSLDDAASQQLSQLLVELYRWQFTLITTGQLPEAVSSLAHVSVQPARSLWGAVHAARRCIRNHDVRIAWTFVSSVSVRASALFQLFTRVKIPFLFTVRDQKITQEAIAKGKKKSWKYRLLFGHVHRWQVIGSMDGGQATSLEEDVHVQTIPDGNDIGLTVKRTKQAFSELEILSSRLS